ncbi:GLPGLI family protein [Chryseobacterium bernardetii]|uniref:GLPGLI family protein n=2 Tax=Chryseobacterium TaxID=59732 RepID=A0A543E9G7_9FLAO|nr:MULTISPECIES: GLPGLI family protein [Chryseobacterium]MDR6371825.1 GLPGLI family protein [Chryseobacterium vietnamense]MDR6443313.1 GLPGLI family protein [Chryseobacterium bernardetii]TQM18240.1 GLPGLI family protein [Chryseobacterium aquifrigidense]
MKSLLFILLGTCMMFAQNNRFIYEVKYKKDSASKDITRENYYLDITKDDIAYYNRLNYISDSLFTATGQYAFKGNRLTSFLIKNNNSNTYQNYEYIGDVNFYKMSEEPRQQWTITDSIKISDHLSLQKGTTKFGGRNWIAWFTKDIPMPYGPYKFNGLPGLIMELYDTKKNYYFNVIKSEKIADDYKRNSLNASISRAIPVTQKDLNKLRLDLYSNPFKYVLNGNLTMREGQKLLLEDGTVLSKEQLKPAEDNERKKLQAFNNPIELDKAVKYP